LEWKTPVGAVAGAVAVVLVVVVVALVAALLGEALSSVPPIAPPTMEPASTTARVHFFAMFMEITSVLRWRLPMFGGLLSAWRAGVREL
jgi:hypothetical protein